MTKIRQSSQWTLARLRHPQNAMSRCRDQAVRRFFPWVIALTVAVGTPARGSEPSVAWKTGTDFRNALTESVGIFWPESPLRDALERLAKRQQVAIMLDRRIDPNRTVTFAAEEQALELSLIQLAAQFDATPSYVGPVIYIGPRESTANLSSLAAERRKESRDLRGQVALRTRADRRWHWNQLAIPTDLINQLALESGISVETLDRIPHDLWPEVDLPALPWTDRLTLVLAGFDSTFEFLDGGARLRLIPLTKQPLDERSYAIATNEVDMNVLATIFPTAAIDASSRRITLRGTNEEHRALERLLRKRISDRPATSSTDDTLYTLKVNSQLVGAILKTVEQRSGTTFQYGPNIKRQLYERVTFNVRDVTLRELLEKTLTPAGLIHRRDGNIIVISVR